MRVQVDAGSPPIVSTITQRAIEVDVADLREGLVMVAEELDEWRAAGLPPVRDPLTVVEQAVALPFAAWWDGLPDA